MQVYQYPHRKVPQDPKHIDWGAILVAGAGLYILSQIKSSSEPSKPNLAQYGGTIQLEKPLAVPVTMKPAASQSNEPGLSPGSRKILRYAVLGGLGIAGFLKLIEGVDLEKLPALPTEQPHGALPTPPLEQPRGVIPTLPPFHLNLPFTISPITSHPVVAAVVENAWMPPPDAEWQRILRHPGVAYIVGKRGSGKSSLGYRLLELLRNQATTGPIANGLKTSGINPASHKCGFDRLRPLLREPLVIGVTPR
jgi:hypothetical protein